MNVAEEKTESLRRSGYRQCAVVLEDAEVQEMCIVTDMGRVTWHDRKFADYVTGRDPSAPEPQWLARVRAETKELDEKIARLEVFNVASVDAAEGGRLIHQLMAMHEYSHVLHERIDAATQGVHE